MSFCGNGVINFDQADQPLINVWTAGSPYPITKFGINASISSSFASHSYSHLPNTCILCGGVILDLSKSNREHPVPRWLLRKTGSENAHVREIASAGGSNAIRRSYTLLAHQSCNTQFGEKLELPASHVMAKLLSRKDIKYRELDILLDWLDKIRLICALSTMQAFGTLANHHLPYGYNVNDRIGRSDRIVTLFRVQNRPNPGLQIYNIEDSAFHSTPSAFCIETNGLFIISVSDSFIMSDVFNLPYCIRKSFNALDLKWVMPKKSTFGVLDGKSLRFPEALTLFQPMLTLTPPNGLEKYAHCLHASGQGKLFEYDRRLQENAITVIRSTDIPEIKLSADLEDRIHLEIKEWLIFLKRRQLAREAHFHRKLREIKYMESMPILKKQVDALRSILFAKR